MPRFFRPALWLFTAYLFWHDFYLWGGLRNLRGVGNNLVKEAKFETPLASGYMFVGGQLVGLLGMNEKAQEYAARYVPEFIEHPEKLEYMAVAQVLDAQGAWNRFCYRFAPIGLVLSFVAHWLRQKQIRSFGSKG